MTREDNPPKKIFVFLGSWAACVSFMWSMASFRAWRSSLLLAAVMETSSTPFARSRECARERRTEYKVNTRSPGRGMEGRTGLSSAEQTLHEKERLGTLLCRGEPDECYLRDTIVAGHKTNIGWLECRNQRAPLRVHVEMLHGILEGVFDVIERGIDIQVGNEDG